MWKSSIRTDGLATKEQPLGWISIHLHVVPSNEMPCRWRRHTRHTARQTPGLGVTLDFWVPSGARHSFLELYSACRCIYYQHAVDRCPKYGEPGHGITSRTILVGYACINHAGDGAQNRLKKPSGVRGSASKDKATPSKAPARALETKPTAIQHEAKQTKQNEKDSKQTSGSLSSSSTAIQTSKFSATENTARVSQAKATPNTSTNQSIASGNPSCAKQRTNSTDFNDKEVGTPSRPSPKSATRQAEDLDDYVFGDDYESDSERSSSNKSVVSETQSIVSVASSNTTVDNDATEAIFRRLLLFRDLQYLWPQLMHRCGSRRMSVTTIERMLRRFSEDLARFTATMHEPDSGICLAASQFVRKARFNIAHRIWEAHREGPDEHEETGNDNLDRNNQDQVEDDDKDFAYDVAERFIFDATPILAFEANVKTFVGFPHAGDDGIASRIYRSAEVWLSNLGSVIHEPPVRPGMQRVRWTCKCGMKLHDDYVELQTGAVLRLEQLLGKYFSSTSEPDEGAGADPSSDGPGKASSLPRHHASKRSAEELGTCPVMPETPHMHHNFVLLCVPFVRLASKLWQAEICRINSDRDFFRVLRHYYSNRGRRPWARLRKVKAVHFVKFEMYHSQLVDIQKRPDIPTEAQAYDSYSFEPQPAETNPPIGPNLLTHLLEHPADAEVLPVLYRKIPKKLRAKLQACPKKGSAVGWGIEFVEGLNWFTVFLCGCVGFMSALVSAIIWSVVRSDVQGGFAIAGFMLAFLGFCLGIARTEVQTA
ncbi:hypothetical protein LA080_005490 [Diaporthe eres]|nr:hypothetical protein LA080_005490 [Diaporthe eres]